DLGGAWIRRATGNATPHDMWTNADHVNGNSGLDIRGVRFDGQYAADSLANANPDHRFCGLRLVKCSGHVDRIVATGTCTGEIQAEGVRTAVCIQDSRPEKLRATNIITYGNLGSGVMVYGENTIVENVLGWDNQGSDLTSA